MSARDAESTTRRTTVRRRAVRERVVLSAFAVTLMVLGMSLFLPRKYKSEAMFERRTDMVLSEMTARGATGNFQ